MKRFVFLGVALFLGLPVLADGENVENAPVKTASSATNPSTRVASQMPESSSSQDTPEEKAYKSKMIKKSDEIAAKIKQIQAMEKAIEEETYLASKPPLVAQKAILEEELRRLQMDRDKLQAEESARKMTQDLKNNTSRSP
ncbi:MAG TPA: hypothetical protein VNK03_05960 [Gammaproteobacteria bacterium]|nr:hypothetical protein [Gammaproteobacteria bacterium]